jgi:SAM-dependent methyltransferase
MTASGEVRASRRDKFVQINEFLRLIVETRELEALDADPLTLVDCGCGSADLTFAVYHYLNHVLARPARLTGVDVKRALLRERAALAERLGWEGLSFVASRIIDFEPGVEPDIVLALHACDTATDEALAQAVAWGSRMIFSVPCCHHDLQAQMKGPAMPDVFQPVLRQGILKERLGDILTDTFRAQLLRMMGYRTDVVEFVSSEHTDKNLMIRAVKFADPGDAQMVREYERLKAYWSVQPFMERLLADVFPDVAFLQGG